MRMIKEIIIQLAPHYVVTHWTWLDFDQKSGCTFRTCLVKRAFG